MFPTNWMGKATGKKLTIMKCKLDTELSVNVMPLSTHQHINHSQFDKKGQPINGYGHDRTILKGYNGNSIKQYGIRVILGKWNNQYWRFVFHIVEAKGPVLLGLNTLRKMGIFTVHPSITIKAIDINPEPRTWLSMTRSRWSQWITVKVQLGQQRKLCTLCQQKTPCHLRRRGM